eukprot:COSAG01_NODE_64713_length_275_cov_1.352273_1_plen_42_part_01
MLRRPLSIHVRLKSNAAQLDPSVVLSIKTHSLFLLDELDYIL